MGKFSFRWGIPLLDDATQYVPVYRFMLRHYAEAGVSRDEFLCITHLADYHYESPNGKAAPSLATIAGEMGYKHENSVRNLIKGMEARDLVKVTRRSGHTSEYDFSAFASRVLALWQASNEATPLQPNAGVGVQPNVGVPLQPNVPEEEEVKKKKTKKEKKNGAEAPKPIVDALIYHAAMEAYRNITHLQVTGAWRVKVARAVGQDVEDLMRWHALVEDWIGFGWNKMNVKGMLETFEGGGIKSRDGKSIPAAPSGRYELAEEDDPTPPPTPRPAPTAPDAPAVLVNGKNPHTQWEVAYGQLQLQMPREAFDTWLRGAKLMTFKPEGNVFCLQVANEYAQAWLEHRLKKVIVRTLSQVVGVPIEVAFALAGAEVPQEVKAAA